MICQCMKKELHNTFLSLQRTATTTFSTTLTVTPRIITSCTSTPGFSGSRPSFQHGKTTQQSLHKSSLKNRKIFWRNLSPTRVIDSFCFSSSKILIFFFLKSAHKNKMISEFVFDCKKLIEKFETVALMRICRISKPISTLLESNTLKVEAIDLSGVIMLEPADLNPFLKNMKKLKKLYLSGCKNINRLKYPMVYDPPYEPFEDFDLSGTSIVELDGVVTCKIFFSKCIFLF